MGQGQADQQVGDDFTDAQVPGTLNDRGIDLGGHVDPPDRPHPRLMREGIDQLVELAHLFARDAHPEWPRRQAQQRRQRGPDRGDAAKHEEHPEQGFHRSAPADRVPGRRGAHDRTAEQKQERTGYGEQASQRAPTQVAGEPVVVLGEVFGELDFAQGIPLQGPGLCRIVTKPSCHCTNLRRLCGSARSTVAGAATLPGRNGSPFPGGALIVPASLRCTSHPLRFLQRSVRPHAARIPPAARIGVASMHAAGSRRTIE
ncbi:hypothetical protein MASR2M50_13120 [Thauera sp.]